MNSKIIISPFLLYHLKHYGIQDEFIRHLEAGTAMDKRRIMSLLIDIYIEYCGISKSYRTVAYDFGSAVFKQYVEDEETGFSGNEVFIDVMNQINPAYIDEKYDRFDICVLTTGEYVVCGIAVLNEHQYSPEECAALSYGLWLFYKQETFYKNLILVEINRKWGFIDKDANETVAPKYDFAHDFSEGRAAVYLNGQWGFIDETGVEVIALQYEEVKNFSEGFAAVEKNGKWGYIDKTGAVTIALQYDKASIRTIKNNLKQVKK